MKKIIILVFFMSLVFTNYGITCEQTPIQTQNQNQNQSQQITSNNNANGGTANSSNNINSISSNNININNQRGFVQQSSMEYGSMIQSSESKEKTHSWIDLKNILYGRRYFTKRVLENMSRNGNVKIKYYVAETELVSNEDWIFVYFDTKQYPHINDMPNGPRMVELNGRFDAYAKDKDTDILSVFGKIGLEIIKNGGNVMHITNINSSFYRESSGWGIGFLTSYAGNGNNDGGIGTIGAGYASSKGYNAEQVFIHGVSIYDSNLKYPKPRYSKIKHTTPLGSGWLNR